MQRTELESWLMITHTQNLKTSYHHSWCRQTEAGRWQPHLPSIIRYLEGAHADAREYFHSTIHLSLDPIQTTRYQPSYPHDMPLKAKKGFFGEALCGMFTEAMEVAGAKGWIVPTFLFRLHREAEEHLFRLVMKEKVPKDIPGRTGSDFVAIAMNNEGQITGFLNGEAKCHEVFNITKCKDFLKELGAEGPVPVSLPQLIRILKDNDLGNLSDIIDSIDEIFLNQSYNDIPKFNLFLYIFDDPNKVNYDTARIDEELKNASYDSAVPLHILEVCIPDCTELVERAYDGLYREAATDGTI